MFEGMQVNIVGPSPEQAVQMMVEGHAKMLRNRTISPEEWLSVQAMDITSEEKNISKAEKAYQEEKELLDRIVSRNHILADDKKIATTTRGQQEDAINEYAEPQEKTSLKSKLNLLLFKVQALINLLTAVDKVMNGKEFSGRFDNYRFGNEITELPENPDTEDSEVGASIYESPADRARELQKMKEKYEKIRSAIAV